MNTLPMTAAGYSVLERELKRRIQLDRPRLIERLQEAIADDSNLAENPEYQAVKSEQEINEARIAELGDKLARAEVIDVSKLSGDDQIWRYGVADRRTYRRNKVWQIVSELEADALQGSISVTSTFCSAVGKGIFPLGCERAGQSARHGYHASSHSVLTSLRGRWLLSVIHHHPGVRTAPRARL
jgi:transcription elongation factor GreA